jgi:hypothetical protein
LRLYRFLGAFGFAEQFARIHHGSRCCMALKSRGAFVDGASLLPPMILAEDICIVGVKPCSAADDETASGGDSPIPQKPRSHHPAGRRA